MSTSTKSRLTGERPQQGVTPDPLLALDHAGYRAVIDRVGQGRLLDVGCGQGFESARFLGAGREVVGVDYSSEATATAASLRRARRPAGGPDGRPRPGLRALELRRGVLVPSHRALHRPGAARRRTGPGAERLRPRVRAHPERAGGLREPDPPSPLDRADLPAIPNATSGTSGWSGSTLLRMSRPTSRRGGPRRTSCSSSTCSTCATGRPTSGTSGPTRGCFRWPTSWWHGTTPGERRASRRATGSSPTNPTRPRSSCSPSPRVEPVGVLPDARGGLTGGIGSGKSAVAERLVERGAVLIDADQVARDVVAPGGPAYEPLVERFGRGSWRRTAPSTARRWPRWPSPTRRPGWPSTPSPTPPSASP